VNFGVYTIKNRVVLRAISAKTGGFWRVSRANVLAPIFLYKYRLRITQDSSLIFAGV